MVTLGYVLLNSATSSFHSFSSAAFAAGGMQSIVIVTLVFGSSGAEASDEPVGCEAPPPLESLLLLVPQAARAVSVIAETTATALARRVRRSLALLIEWSPSGKNWEGAPPRSATALRGAAHSTTPNK
ncbi:hypothetical protein GCM10010363_29320 [Streptomyces omiyaensis]|nr:hypothetical protein GCM10010363_29320 [Streptomyces omiyaensis]